MEHITYTVAIDAGNGQQHDVDNDMMPCPPPPLVMHEGKIKIAIYILASSTIPIL